MRTQVFLNDCIVVWRAWILWKRYKMVLVASFVLLLCALGALYSPVHLQTTQPAPLALFVTSLVLLDLGRVQISPGMAPLEMIMSFAMSVATNLYATILVGIRTWYVLNLRRVLRPHQYRMSGNTGTPYGLARGPLFRSRSLFYSSSLAPYTSCSV
jgi:hypothetical protein